MDGSSIGPIKGDTFDEKIASVVSLLANKKNIVVLAGAGISVSCGIPDFRSATGLYNTLNYQELGLASPEDLFDLETFRDDPRPFYKFAKSLYPGSIEPGESHKFLSWLDRNKMLLRIYTQNIDSLEQSAGVRTEKVIYAHGSLLGATCMKCKAKYCARDIASDVQSGTVPLCQRPRKKKAKLSCESSAKTKSTTAPPVTQTMSLRRSSRTKRVQSETDNNFEVAMKQGLCCGVIKPNITFFGEKLANDVGRSLQKDYETADALIVMGTSLSVAPMSKVVEYLSSNIPRILINRNIVRVPKSSEEDDGHLFHACLLGNCDDVVKALEQRMKSNCSQTKSASINYNGSKGLVTSNEAWLQNQPKESVLLFPGAVVSDSQESEAQHKLVVHCDECQKEIEGDVFCCKNCFDYDLCRACYTRVSLTHADGKHDFVVEK
ncbi:hypothetical protein ACHAXR_007837 [Thalassiosira sp. AJA248-18]